MFVKSKRGMSIPMLVRRFVDGGGEPNSSTSDTLEPSATPNTPEPPKTFTQEEVNAMMAKEKRSGKVALLKSLGFESEEKAQEQLKQYNEFLEAQKTQAQIVNENLTKEQEKNAELAKNLIEANLKMSLITSGANAQFLDELVVLAKSRMSEDVEIDSVVKELKKKVPTFFESTGSGTGNPIGHQRGQAPVESLGLTLAKQKMGSSKTATQNPYFKK